MQLTCSLKRSRTLSASVLVSAILALLGIGAGSAQAEINNPQLSAGVYSTCSITTAKRLYCWGSNSSNQLGLGSVAKLSYGTRPYPVKGLKAQPASLSNGYSSACATLITGSISCWGKNSAGQLGPSNQGGFARSAQSIASLISPWLAPSNATVGAQSVCFRDNNQTVKCLGGNAYGQLGNASNAPSNTPVHVATITATSDATEARQVVSGANHSCARLSNQNVKCWGVNNYRQLGTPTNTVAWVNSPVDVPNLSNNVNQIASMADHTCAVHDGGAASCWGANQYGQLGDGTVAPFKGNVTVTGLGADVRQISTGIGHTCALIQGGAIKCWGSNEFGQLGNGTTTTSAKPVSVIGLSRPASELSVGGYHSCARLDNNQVYCWGRGSKGQLGNGDNETSATAKPVLPVGGIHYSSVQLTKTDGHANFQGTFVAVPARSGTLSSQCRTNAHLTVSVLQDNVTKSKTLVKRLRPSGSTKCTARFSVRAITNSVASAQVTLKGSYRGTSTMPGASFTQVYANP